MLEVRLRLDGGGQVEVAAAVSERSVEVEVRDSSPVMPVVRHPAELEEGGRGLWLVDQLATSWGARRVGGAKVVWFRSSQGHPVG